MPLSAMFHWFFVLVESSEYYKKCIHSCLALSTEPILTNVNKGQIQLKARSSSNIRTIINLVRDI